ncbi:MAG TPA: LLM class flavin-dependent oxidoreductase [Microlunatus sp.]|nr:LLM class flavin-dependent oxidoreductase [Microlunatus sp.]
MTVNAKPPLDLVERDLAAARELGLDAVMVWDHVQDFYPSALWDQGFGLYADEHASPHTWFDYQTLLGYLSAHAGELRVGVGVTEPFRRHPIVIAQAAATLAHLSDRPPILGIGAGERENTDPYGLPFDRPVGRLEEALQIIRTAFTSQGPFDFHGRHYQLDGAVLDLQPPPGRTPQIWIAAHGPRMLRLTGRYGDGWYPFAIGSPDDYAARLGVIRAAAADAGRDPEAIIPSWTCLTVIGRTEAEARSMLDTNPVRFWGLLFSADIWRLFGVKHPFGEQFRGYLDILPEQCRDRDALDAAIAAVPQGLIELAIWGTPAQIVEKLQAFGEAGLRHVVPWVPSALVSPDAADYTRQALGEIAQALRSDVSRQRRPAGTLAAVQPA